MTLKTAGWVAAAIFGTLVVLAIVAAAGSRTETLRLLVVATLSDRLNSDVELRTFSVDTFPTVTIRGEGLVLKLRGLPSGPNVPPLIQIESFTVHCGIIDLFRRPRRFRHVTLDRLVVNIPPGGLRNQQNPVADAATDSTTGQSGMSPIIVDSIQADDARLRIIPRREGKIPREFAIHSLHMQSLGLAQQMPFKATLTNPIPQGQIETSGTFGPWQKNEPELTPLAGRYTFAKADLGTIKGIGGILESSGEFGGQLERISVKGETTTPDFHLDITAQPVPLNTKFEAVVDGTDGDTYLNNVDAQFLRTSLNAKGKVVRTPGIKGRTIELHVRIPNGRVEDLLRLSVKGDNPLMVGSVGLHTDFTLPPGEADVIQRLRLAGEFGVGSARFTDPDVEKKLAGMSLRARGLDPEEKAENVVSDLSGKFRLRDSVLSFSNLSFTIPGATVQLQCWYGLKSEALSFDGTLRLQATLSQAAGGGLKSVFLKLIDPLFRKKDAGAVVPIRVAGTRQQPKFGLDVGRVLKRK
jgi:AsmA-like C-terminal region